MEKSKKRVSIDAKQIEQTNIEIAKANFNDIEIEKKAINEEIARNKRYLIEEILYDGKELTNQIEKKSKRSWWSRFIDFIFK